MGAMSKQQLDSLISAIDAHEFLSRLRDTIEQCHRLVFHANEHADWTLVRKSAEQILVTELVLRHKGNIDGIYFDLRKLEAAGMPWSAAINELANRIHSYFTTPLGIVLRKDLLGQRAVFFTSDAYEWIRRREAGRAAAAGETA